MVPVICAVCLALAAFAVRIEVSATGGEEDSGKGRECHVAAVTLTHPPPAASHQDARGAALAGSVEEARAGRRQSYDPPWRTCTTGRVARARPPTGVVGSDKDGTRFRTTVGDTPSLALDLRGQGRALRGGFRGGDLLNRGARAGGPRNPVGGEGGSSIRRPRCRRRRAGLRGCRPPSWRLPRRSA